MRRGQRAPTRPRLQPAPAGKWPAKAGRMHPPPLSAPISPAPVGRKRWAARSMWPSVSRFYTHPGVELRLDILQKVCALLRPGGRFIHSEWQFMNSDRLKAASSPGGSRVERGGRGSRGCPARLARGRGAGCAMCISSRGRTWIPGRGQRLSGLATHSAPTARMGNLGCTRCGRWCEDQGRDRQNWLPRYTGTPLKDFGEYNPAGQFQQLRPYVRRDEWHTRLLRG